MDQAPVANAAQLGFTLQRGSGENHSQVGGLSRHPETCSLYVYPRVEEPGPSLRPAAPEPTQGGHLAPRPKWCPG